MYDHIIHRHTRMVRIAPVVKKGRHSAIFLDKGGDQHIQLHRRNARLQHPRHFSKRPAYEQSALTH